VQGAKVGAQTVLRCKVDDDDRRDNREIPAWMFDGARCSRMQISPLPWVSWEALRELRRLLDGARDRRGPGALEDRSSPSAERTDEPAKEATEAERTERPVLRPGDGESSAMGGPLGGHTTISDRVVRADAAAVSSGKGAKRGARGGA